VQPLRWLDFVIVDVETTGWSPEEERITELGAVRVSGGRVREVYASLVNPGRPVPASVSDLTGITDALVAAAPPVSAVLPGFLAFASGSVLTAHNAPFDMGFLTTACQACGLPWPRFPVLDTAELARSVLGPDEVPDRKLGTLARHFGTAVMPRHRALADALATAGVLTCLLDRLAAAGVRTLTGLIAAGTAPPDRPRRYATADSAAAGSGEASRDHRDRPGAGQCGEDPGDRRGHRPDPAGQ
jgi:DNA polymerase-3 subunit epsilon